MNIRVTARAAETLPREVAKARAIGIFEVYHRYGLFRYADILTEVRASQAKAGSPALRFAKTAMYGEQRARHNRQPWIKLEQDHFSHLALEHRSVPAARRYHVWRAMEDYYRQRLDKWGPPDLLPPPVPKLWDTDWQVEEALIKLDQTAQFTHKRYAAGITAICVEVNPSNPKIVPVMLALANTIWAREVWLRSGCRDAGWERFFKLSDAKLASFRKYRPWLAQTRLQAAFDLLDASFPPSPALAG